MFRFLTVVTVVALMAGSAVAQDRRASGGRGGRTLPKNYSKLGLTDEQKDKIYSIRSKYGDKIEGLRHQISELVRQERSETEAVLTEAQRARLREIVSEAGPGGGKGDTKATDGKPPTTDKKPSPEDKKP